ncbi:unnamed protein product, partial [Larinioides sclopetarius]
KEDMWIYSIFCLLFAGSLKSEVCLHSDTESLLHPGYEYTYRFSSEAIAEAVGITNDKGKISIDCDVFLSHTTYCFYSFHFNNCIVNAKGGLPGNEVAWIADRPLSDLSKYPVLFSLENGEITEVYTDENDPIQFVNIKRGALSAFVFKISYTTKEKVELHTDIHGTCPMSSTPLDTSKGLVRTTKNMQQCAFPSRKDWQFSPYSVFWNMSFIQYIINSTTDCDYTININEKILDKVYCKERHAVILQSTSSNEVSIQSIIHYNIEYLNRNPVIEMKDFSFLTRKTDIRYEYERTPDPTSNQVDFMPVAMKLLAGLVEHSVDEIKLPTIPQFTNFVAWIRSATCLIPFSCAVKSCSYLSEKECTPLIKELGMSYLKDALIQCNTVACFKAIAYLVKAKDISVEFLNYYAWGSMHISKPTIIKYIKSICHDTDSELCWASLGSLIRRSYSTYSDPTEMLFSPDFMLLKDVAKYFHDNIGQLCVSADPNSKAYSLLIRNLKTVRNMGEIYLQLIPDGFQQLTDCIYNSFVPDSVRTFALETLRVVSPCEKEESCDKIYNILLPLLLNTSESTTLRALSYEYLTRLPLKNGFEEEIFAILKTDGNIQLKSYMASNLKSLFNDLHYLKKEKRFIKSMYQLLNDNDLSLNAIVNSPEAKSLSNINSLSVDLPFMPEGMKAFGFRAISSQIYESSDVFARYFSHEMIFEAFRLEKVAIVFQRLVKDFNSEMPSFATILSALKEVEKEFKPQSSEPSKEYNFRDSILRNIRRLEQMYRTFKPKSKSFISGFSDLFGSTVSYFSSGNTASISELLEIQTLLDNLERGLVYNSTRVLRVIEAYHQVPTMMGLPLNWTANGTLAFSWRSGFKMSFNQKEFGIHSQGFIHPSAALTFLNRMVIDFPTVTQIGVQANNSAYTSTQWEAKVDYSKSKKNFSFIKPLKTQKILEFFRTYQLIKHDSYEDIEDWDIERTSSSHCTNDKVGSLFGLQVCLSKSHPVVTSSEKAWALMAGWCKWQLLINPLDENLEAYNIEIVESSEFKSKELIVKYSTSVIYFLSGSESKHEIFLKVVVDDSKGERKILVEIPELPDFGFAYIQKEHKEKRYSTIVILKLEKGQEYRLTHNEGKILDQTELKYKSKNQPLPKRVLVYEYLLSLDTPYNRYEISKENHKHGDDEKTKVLLSYENQNSSGKWLHTILPESLWESEKKAWFQFEINWKGEELNSQAVNHKTVCFKFFCFDPKILIHLNANSFALSLTEQVNMNSAKTEISTRKFLMPSHSLHGFRSTLLPTHRKIQPRYRPSKSSKIAMIFGPLHVYTFDGRVYDSAEYSSGCTFLLAHDLHKSSFTVLSDKNAIHILFPEMVVTVNEENEVFVNGSSFPSTLPIESHNRKVIVRRSEVVEIWSPTLRVVCRSNDFLCVLELDALHSGSTFGLLGNADGSSRNEFTLPEGNITDDSLDFVTSYEVTGKSECKKLKLRQRTNYSQEAISTCASQFSRLCRFDKITLESFQDACKLDLEDNKQACYAAAGYSALCFYKNLKGTLNCNGKERESKKVGQKLEVVFIVHEHHSLAVSKKKPHSYKGIERVLRALAEKFQTNGYSKVSFSLIGFGGKGARYQPTLHARKSSWVPLHILVGDLLRTLQFEGSEDVDVLEAVKYALEVMGYDTFHSKNKNKKIIDELKQDLLQNGITVYSLSSYPSIEKGVKVFGVRADGHIFQAPKKIEKYILPYPKGDLAELTSATRGSVFLAKFVLSNSPQQFFREFANAVWARIRNQAEVCTECLSVRSGWWWQVNECNKVHCYNTD